MRCILKKLLDLVFPMCPTGAHRLRVGLVTNIHGNRFCWHRDCMRANLTDCNRSATPQPALTFDDLPVGASLDHIIPMCAIDMRHGEVEIHESSLRGSAKIDLKITPWQLWELEDRGKVVCISDSGEDPALSYRYINYIKK